MERQFTYVGGTSSKFRAVALDGTTVTVRFGRIGTNGQTRTKTFPSDAGARTYAEDAVKEKLAKGYVETAGAGSAPASPAPAAAAARPAPATTPAAAPTVAPPSEDDWTVPALWWRHATYSDVVERLGRRRTWSGDVRVATSHLLPTQQQWVAHDVDAVAARASQQRFFPALLASVTDVGQARTLLRVLPSWRVVEQTSLLYSLAAHVGPAAAPLLLDLYDENEFAHDEAARVPKLIVSLVAHLPTDDALAGLLRRHDRRHVRPALMTAMTRFPDRGKRLAAAAAAGTGPGADAARQLLRAIATGGPAHGRPEAPAEAVPPLLVTPPWSGRRSAPSCAVVEGLAADPRIGLGWEPGERERWSAIRSGWGHDTYWASDWPRAVARARRSRDWQLVHMVACGPDDLVRPLLAEEPRPTSGRASTRSRSRWPGGARKARSSSFGLRCTTRGRWRRYCCRSAARASRRSWLSGSSGRRLPGGWRGRGSCGTRRSPRPASSRPRSVARARSGRTPRPPCV